MSKNLKPAATKPAEAAAVTPPKNNFKRYIFLAVAVAVVAGIASAAVLYFKDKSDTPHVEEVKAAPPKQSIFIALEPFTVNLQKETADQYLQVGVTLKFFDAALQEQIKAALPEIRGKILLLLATKNAAELSTPEGKIRLIEEIVTLSNAVLGIVNKPAPVVVAAHPASAPPVAEAEADTEAAAAPAPPPKAVEKKGIVDVLFTSFIIQ